MKTILVLLFLISFCYAQSKVIYTKDTLGNYVYNKKAIDELIQEHFQLKFQYQEALKQLRYNRLKVHNQKLEIDSLKARKK